MPSLDVSFDAVCPTGSVPARGPLIVAANHPTGALDGLVVCELIRRTRPDVRVLANRLLARIPDLRHVRTFLNARGRLVNPKNAIVDAQMSIPL